MKLWQYACFEAIIISSSVQDGLLILKKNIYYFVLYTVTIIIVTITTSYGTFSSKYHNIHYTYRMFSLIVPANKTGSCPTTATWFLKCLTLISLKSFPDAVTDPESGSYILCRSWSTVDLPLPLAPTRATVSLLFIFKLSPFRTCLKFFLFYCLFYLFKSKKNRRPG